MTQKRGIGDGVLLLDRGQVGVIDRGDVMSVALPHVRGPGFAASAAGIAVHGKAGRLRHASTGCDHYRAKYGEKRTTGRIIIQPRPAQRRVGTECVSVGRSRWSPSHSNDNTVRHNSPM